LEALKDTLESSFLVFENELNGQARSLAHQRRREAFARFEDLGFPTKRHEEWKYTNLKPILNKDYRVFTRDENHLEYADVRRYFLGEIDSYKLVFVDGIFNSYLSETTHQGFDICTFSSMLEKYPNVTERYFAQAAPADDALAQLNTAFASEGAFIRIKKGQTVDKPVQIIYFTTRRDYDVLAQPRNLVVVEENAEVSIVERHQSLGEQSLVLTNSVTELFAERQTRVHYYKLQNDSLNASLIDHLSVKQAEGSRVHLSTYTFGNRFVRNNVNFYLEESHTESFLDGISIIGDGQLADHHTLVDHQVPHCYSNELYKGIYDGNAKGVFNGKVYVHPHAQKTNAFQQNNNILLSDKATIDTKPQLEIYADDVQCSHGCTIGQIDEKALFYLMARGIPEKEARALLLYAFTGDGLRNVTIKELRKKLNYLIAKKLGVDLDFEI